MENKNNDSRNKNIVVYAPRQGKVTTVSVNDGDTSNEFGNDVEKEKYVYLSRVFEQK